MLILPGHTWSPFSSRTLRTERQSGSIRHIDDELADEVADRHAVHVFAKTAIKTRLALPDPPQSHCWLIDKICALSSKSTMARKRSLETVSDEQATEAATLNARVFKKLEKALASDPEVDLLSLFPSNYSTRLKKRKKTVTDNNGMSRVLFP